MQKIKLNAFPLTPLHNDSLDENAYEKIIERLVEAKVDSICLLGSTGCGPYYSNSSREQVIQKAIGLSSGIDVMVGVSAVSFNDILRNADMAESAGATSILIAPFSYHSLSNEEVYFLYTTLSQSSSVPIYVYENIATTGVCFSSDLIESIFKLPNIKGIKINSVRQNKTVSKIWLEELRAQVNIDTEIGLSGDHNFLPALSPQVDTWHSVLAGLFPNTCQTLLAALERDDVEEVQELRQSLEPLLKLFTTSHGSVRIINAVAEVMGIVKADALPKPLRPLRGEDLKRVQMAIEQTNLWRGN